MKEKMIPDSDKFFKMASALKVGRAEKVQKTASAMVYINEKYAHECEVILPAEELFARSHGMTVERLEEDWGNRRAEKGFLWKDGAELRDKFYEIVDEIAESQGKVYDEYVHEVDPQNFMKIFKEKTGL